MPFYIVSKDLEVEYYAFETDGPKADAAANRAAARKGLAPQDVIVVKAKDDRDAAKVAKATFNR